MPPAHVFLVTVAYFSIKWRGKQPCPACSWMTTDAKSPGLSEPLCHVPPRGNPPCQGLDSVEVSSRSCALSTLGPSAWGRGVAKGCALGLRCLTLSGCLSSVGSVGWRCHGS